MGNRIDLIRKLGAEYPVQGFLATQRYSPAARDEMRTVFQQDIEQVFRHSLQKAVADILQQLSSQGHSVLCFKDYQDFHGDKLDQAATIQDYVQLITDAVEEGQLRDLRREVEQETDWEAMERLIGKPAFPYGATEGEIDHQKFKADLRAMDWSFLDNQPAGDQATNGQKQQL